jgi:hypothetical protein
MRSKPPRSDVRRLEAAGLWPRPRSRRAFRARDVPRRRSARCDAPVSRFRGSRLRRGARRATCGASRDAADDPCAGREAPALLRRAESRHRRSAAGAPARRPSRRREASATSCGRIESRYARTVRLAHLSLGVADQQRSRRFYETFFGFVCDGDPDREGCLHLTDADDFDLTLVARPNVSPSASLHFGIGGR